VRHRPPEKEAEPHQIVLYLGCNVLRTSHMIRTVTAIFDRLGSTTSPSAVRPTAWHRPPPNGEHRGVGRDDKRTVELFQRYKPKRS